VQLASFFGACGTACADRLGWWGFENPRGTVRRYIHWEGWGVVILPRTKETSLIAWRGQSAVNALMSRAAFKSDPFAPRARVLLQRAAGVFTPISRVGGSAHLSPERRTVTSLPECFFFYL
jgi:hypothetical protein